MNIKEDIKTYQPLANREYKSSVFTSYFSIPEHASSQRHLLWAHHGTLDP